MCLSPRNIRYFTTSVKKPFFEPFYPKNGKNALQFVYFALPFVYFALPFVHFALPFVYIALQFVRFALPYNGLPNPLTARDATDLTIRCTVYTEGVPLSKKRHFQSLLHSPTSLCRCVHR